MPAATALGPAGFSFADVPMRSSRRTASPPSLVGRCAGWSAPLPRGEPLRSSPPVAELPAAHESKTESSLGDELLANLTDVITS
jgi:hypothetical protein